MTFQAKLPNILILNFLSMFKIQCVEFSDI